MDHSQQELFQFLMNMVPRHISDVSISMNQELVDIRKNLIRKARIITEFRYFLKRFLADSKTEKKVRKFEADYFNSPSFKQSPPSNSKQKTMRKSISIDQNFLNCLLNNEEIINVATPQLIKKNNKKDNYSDNEYFGIDTENNFVSFLFSPKETSPFLGLSLVSQNSSVIINYIHENPSIFIEALINNQNHPYYAHITQSIIPSIFGYFSSSEYLDLASEFYIKLLTNEKVTPEIAIPILAPFFNSPASYRFTEKVYSEFFQKVINDNKEFNFVFEEPKPPSKITTMSASPSIDLAKAYDNKEQTDPRVYNARLLNICILKSAPLLPIQFFNVFKQLRVRRWTLKDWYNLFFREFILISMNQWIRSTFRDEYVEILFNLMSRKFITKRELAMLFKNILKLESACQPPQLFNCFKCPATVYLLSIRNMQILVSFLSEKNILPPSVDTLSFDNVSQQHRHSSFWCNVYSRKSSTDNFTFSMEKAKEMNDGRLVFQSFRPIQAEIEKEEANQTNLCEMRKEFLLLQKYAERYDQTNSIEFMLKNSGKGDFYRFAQRRCLANLIELADSFEEVMELLRVKKEIHDWMTLFQSNENMLVLSHLTMFDKRMDVVQSMPTFIKQAIFLNRIDENKFKRFRSSFVEIGKHWDLIVHSPHFSTFKFSSSLSYAPSPTTSKSNQPQKNSKGAQKVEKKKEENKKKMVNSSSTPNLSSLNTDAKQQRSHNHAHEESPNISEVSSDIENEPPQISERNNLNKLRRISVNYSNSDLDKNANDPNGNTMSRSMSSEGLFSNKLEPFSPLKHLPVSFFQTLDLVSLIEHVRLPEKFLIMMKVLEQIEFFSNQSKSDFSLLIILLQNIPGQILIPMYIILNVFAMREPNIFLLCSELERKRWLNFEQIVLKCASENIDFLSKLLNLQSQIQDEFNRWKDKNFKNW